MYIQTLNLVRYKPSHIELEMKNQAQDKSFIQKVREYLDVENRSEEQLIKMEVMVSYIPIILMVLAIIIIQILYYMYM